MEKADDRRALVLWPAMMIDAPSIPAECGAYVLLVRLRDSLKPGIRTLGDRILEPGTYAYCGSAHGPGGLRARVSRHLRTGKALRWHVDRLTLAGRIEAVAVRVGGRECDLVDALLARGATVPIPRFGSSDCRRCPAHLLSLPGQFDKTALNEAVGLGRGTAVPL